jgi:flagellar basal body rod protein FlgG
VYPTLPYLKGNVAYCNTHGFKGDEPFDEPLDYKQVILQVINQNKELQDLLIKQQEELNNKKNL